MEAWMRRCFALLELPDSLFVATKSKQKRLASKASTETSSITDCLWSSLAIASPHCVAGEARSPVLVAIYYCYVSKCLRLLAVFECCFLCLNFWPVVYKFLSGRKFLSIRSEIGIKKGREKLLIWKGFFWKGSLKVNLQKLYRNRAFKKGLQ